MTLKAKVPPVVVGAAALGLMWWLAEALPGLNFDFTGRLGLAGALGTLGFALTGRGVLSFILAHTSVDPHHPSKATHLVTDGVYRFTRNPMYLGLATALMGAAVWLGNPLGLIGVAFFVVWIDRLQIPAEEEALKRIFGAEFERFTKRTRRWL